MARVFRLVIYYAFNRFSDWVSFQPAIEGAEQNSQALTLILGL
jgi:hypothetical protein